MITLVKGLLLANSEQETMALLINALGIASLEASELVSKALADTQVTLVNGKIGMKSITITHNESERLNPNEVFTDWKPLNKILRAIAKDCKDYNCGIIITCFTIEWNDGHTHDGKLNTSSRYDKNIGKHIGNYYKACAGIRNPSASWTEEEYQQAAKINRNTLVKLGATPEEVSTDAYKTYLEKYEL